MKPTLNKNISSYTFQNYYWLKTELIKFCRDTGLSTVGAKKDIEIRIVHYLNTGKKLSLENRKVSSSINTKVLINLDTLLKDAYKNDLIIECFLNQ
ncbi:SAP domain-containing protein [Francisellaceae bacterium CB300]